MLIKRPASKAFPVERPIFLVSAPCAGTGPIFELLSRARHVATLGNSARQELRTRLESGEITAGQIRSLVRVEGRWLSAIVANARQIPLLNEAYPDALFIYVHRDAKEQLARMELDGHSGIEWAETTARIMSDLAVLPARRWCAIDIDAFLANRPHEAALLGRFAEISWRVKPGPAARAGRRPSVKKTAIELPALAGDAAIFARANHASSRDLPKERFWRVNVAKAVVSSRLAAGLTVGAVSLPVAASATTLQVTNNSDTGVSGDGSLRGEILAASPGDTITFAQSLNGETITLTGGQIKIEESLTIQGPGSGELTIDGNASSVDGGLTGGDRIFYLYATTTPDGGSKVPADVTISGLTLQHGNNADDGGAILKKEANLTLTDVVIKDSVSGESGGGIGAIDQSGGTFTLQDSTIEGCTAAGTGGGFYSYANPGAVLLTNDRLTGNTATNTGGFYVGHGGTVTVQGSTISSNVATSAFGGAQIYASGDTLVEDTTITGNTSGESGGGIMLGSLTSAAVVNSTISGNSVLVSTDGGTPQMKGGGGVYLNDNSKGPITIADTTIAGNSATIGGGIFLNGSNAVVVNSIVAGNMTAGDSDAGVSASVDVAGNDVTDTFQVSYSLIQNAGTANFIDSDGGMSDAGGEVLGEGNIVGQDPLLGALANNGGSTETMLPAGNSPVINTGDPNFPADATIELSDASVPAPTTDQRGGTRVVGGRIDMGAVEVVPDAGPPPDAGSTPTTDGGTIQSSDAGSTTTAGKGCNCNGTSDAALALLTPIGLLLMRRRRNPSRMRAR